MPCAAPIASAALAPERTDTLAGDVAAEAAVPRVSNGVLGDASAVIDGFAAALAPPHPPRGSTERPTELCADGAGTADAAP